MQEVVFMMHFPIFHCWYSSGPSHYLNQCWIIANWTIGNELKWNSNRNQYIFIQENAFKNVVSEMAAREDELRPVDAYLSQWTGFSLGNGLLLYAV